MCPMSNQIQCLEGFRLPKSRAYTLSLLALFVCIQVADALLTAFGINRFGVGAEANPVLALGFVFVGPVAALAIAKSAAVAGAVALYRLSRHGLLAMLTMMYVVVAIMPWAWALVVA
jgi:hypothetical protein